MKAPIRIRALLGVALGSYVGTLACQTRDPIGIYELVTAGTQPLPAIGSRILTYEGGTLHSARLELKQGGGLQGQIVASFTDSGTVTDTMLVTGRWERHRATVRISYQYSEFRWQGGPRSFQAGRPVNGVLTRSELTLPELAGFDEHWFGEATPLHFRHVD